MRARIAIPAALLAVLVGLAAVHMGMASTNTKPARKTVAAASHSPKCGTLAIHAPNSINGLKVSIEDPCSTFAFARGDRAVDKMGLLSIRQGDNLLIATLEVARFVAQAPLHDAGFRAGVIDAIGDTQPSTLVVGGRTVYSSTSAGLFLVSWMQGRYLYVLAIRDSYAFPKALLRGALAVHA